MFLVISSPIWLSWLIYWAYIGFPIKFGKKVIDTEHSNGINQVAQKVFLVSRKNAWKRFFARYIDFYVFAFVLGVLLPFLPQEFSLILKSNYLFMLIILFLWVFIEAFFLTCFGSTPGKWLLKINIHTQDNTKWNYTSALKRAFSVWFVGMGVGFPIVSLFTQISAYSDLTRRGTTSWDKKYNLQITYQPLGIVRIIIIVSLLVSFILLIWWGSTH